MLFQDEVMLDASLTIKRRRALSRNSSLLYKRGFELCLATITLRRDSLALKHVFAKVTCSACRVCGAQSDLRS